MTREELRRLAYEDLDRALLLLAIVNAKGSSIAREADMLIYTHAGPEIAVASTKAYMVQIAVMYLIACELALAVGAIDGLSARGQIRG